MTHVHKTSRDHRRRIGQDAASNWWEAGGATGCEAAYNATGAASLAASYTDLSGNGNDAAPGVAPTWANGTGWIFNGSTQYLTTGVIPASGYSVLIQFTNATTPGGTPVFFGCRGDPRFYMQRNVGNNISYNYGSAAVNVAPDLTAGNLGIVGNQGYRNGAADGAAVGGSWSGSLTKALPIACFIRENGDLANFSAFYCQAFAIYDNTLSAPQVLAVAAAMAAL